MSHGARELVLIVICKQTKGRSPSEELKSWNIGQDLFDFSKLLLNENDRQPLSDLKKIDQKDFKAQKIALVPVGEPNSNYLDKVTQTLRSSLKERALVVSNDLMKTRTCDTQLLIVQPGKCNRKGLAQIQQSLALQGTNVEGWLLLDNRTNVL